MQDKEQVRMKYKQSTRENNKNLDGNMDVCVVCCQVDVSATGRSLVQRSPYRLWCVTVLSRNLKNEAALARVGLLRQKEGGGGRISYYDYARWDIYIFGYVFKNIFTHAINKRRHQQDKHNNTECISKHDILWHAKLS